MTAVQKLAELEAEEKLNAKGWHKRLCPLCAGTKTVHNPMNMFFEPCRGCDAAGVIWQHIDTMQEGTQTIPLKTTIS